MALSASSKAAFELHTRLEKLQVELGGDTMAISHHSVHFDRDSAAKRRELGNGSFGKVWAAQLQLQQAGSTPIPVAVKAVKRMHSLTNDTQRIIRDFESELKALWQLRGLRHIVQLHGYCVYPAPAHTDEYHLIMEQMGSSLSKYIKEHTASGTITWLQRFGWCLQLCIGTANAHAKGITNHDLKPGNCLLSEDGRTLKLGDFGLAHIKKDLDGTTTLGHHAGGTDRFMSPEQWRFRHIHTVWKDRKLDNEKALTTGFHRRVDVWAISCCMQSIFSDGQLPFVGLSDQAFEGAVRGEWSALQRNINPFQCPHRSRLESLVISCMQSRNPSASELARELQWIIQMNMEGGVAFLQALDVPLLPANAESTFHASSYTTPLDSIRSLPSPEPEPTALGVVSDAVANLFAAVGFVARTVRSVGSTIMSHTRSASVQVTMVAAAAGSSDSLDTEPGTRNSHSTTSTMGQQQQHGRASSDQLPRTSSSSSVAAASVSTLSSMPPLTATERDESPHVTPQPKRRKSTAAAAAAAALVVEEENEDEEMHSIHTHTTRPSRPSRKLPAIRTKRTSLVALPSSTAAAIAAAAAASYGAVPAAAAAATAASAASASSRNLRQPDDQGWVDPALLAPSPRTAPAANTSSRGNEIAQTTPARQTNKRTRRAENSAPAK